VEWGQLGRKSVVKRKKKLGYTDNFHRGGGGKGKRAPGLRPKVGLDFGKKASGQRGQTKDAGYVGLKGKKVWQVGGQP